MRKISLTRSALVTGCILISSIPLQGKSKKSLSGARQPDYWINRFENHKYFDTHQAPVFDSVNIKALLQQKQPSNIPEKE